MKRISIITYVRAYNYGSALQAYALNKFLTLQGYSVQTIDYTTKQQQQLYRIFEPSRGIMSFARNIQSFFYLRTLRKHKRKFDDFVSDFIPLTNKILKNEDLTKLNSQYDYFICGSDQIWNAQCEDFDSNYMLSFVDDKFKCIAYAPSLGAGGRNPKTSDALSTFVKGYKAVSSREKGSVEIIQRSTGCSVKNVLDPVFLLSSEQWAEVAGNCPINQDYILGYFIGDVAGMRDFANQLSKESKLPVIVIYKSIRDVKYGFKTFYEAGPSDFVSLIMGAKYIVTNSFHAVSFSLIFEKSFWAFIQRDSSDERLRSILTLVDLADRIIDIDSSNDIDRLSYIDYEKVNRNNLHAAIESSKSFLKSNIGYETL